MLPPQGLRCRELRMRSLEWCPGCLRALNLRDHHRGHFCSHLSWRWGNQWQWRLDQNLSLHDVLPSQRPVFISNRKKICSSKSNSYNTSNFLISFAGYIKPNINLLLKSPSNWRDRDLWDSSQSVWEFTVPLPTYGELVPFTRSWSIHSLTSFEVPQRSETCNW